MRRFALGCIFLLALPLAALITENTASASALAGVTLLSESVADFQLSPALPFTGVAVSAQVPFSDTPSTIVSLSAAQRFKFLILNTGAVHSGDSAYNAQDFRLGLSLNLGDFNAGYSQHLCLERAGTNLSHQSWHGDAAISYRGDSYGYEARLMRIGQPDSELHLSVSTSIVKGIQAASSYIYSPKGQDGYRFATSIQIVDKLLLQSSWQSDPARFGAGLKFQLETWDLIYAIRTHPDLRLSHSLDLSYRW